MVTLMIETDPLKIAQELKQEADHLLFDRGIDALLKTMGEVFYTGSYALDLMIWPDLDLHLLLRSQQNIVDQLLDLGKAFAKYPEILVIKLEKDLYLRNPQCPKGHYLQIKLAIGNWKLPWKLDIWVLDKKSTEDNAYFIQTIKKALTPELRELILTTKHALLTEAGRTPSFSGYHLYQAILFKGLRVQQDIYAYLQAQGIKLP